MTCARSVTTIALEVDGKASARLSVNGDHAGGKANRCMGGGDTG